MINSVKPLSKLMFESMRKLRIKNIDVDRILEFDVLRWLLLMGGTQPGLMKTTQNNLQPEDFKISICRAIYSFYLECHQEKRPCDLLSIATVIEDAEIQPVISEILKVRVNKERAELHLIEAIQKVLDRNWMEKREQIRIRIIDGRCSDEEALILTKQFEELKRNPPKVKEINHKHVQEAKEFLIDLGYIIS